MPIDPDSIAGNAAGGVLGSGPGRSCAAQFCSGFRFCVILVAEPVAASATAGPAGGTATKPIGLVFISISTRRTTQCLKCFFKGSRLQVKKQATDVALNLLLKYLWIELILKMTVLLQDASIVHYYLCKNRCIFLL